MPTAAVASCPRPARLLLAGALGACLALGPAAGAAGQELATLTGAPQVPLWPSAAALEAAARTPGAPGLERPTCTVPRGTRARVARVPDSYAFVAEVADGPHAGCRGVVSPRDFETTGATVPAGLTQERVGSAPAAATAAPAGGGRWTLWERWTFHDLQSLDAPGDDWREVTRTDRSTDCDAAKRERVTRADESTDAFADRVQTQLRRRFRTLPVVRLTPVPHPEGWDVHLTVRGPRGEAAGRSELRYVCLPADQPPAGARPGGPR